MYGDKWWGYLSENGVVTITPMDRRPAVLEGEVRPGLGILMP